MDLLRHLFFENPLPLWIVLGLAAVGAGFYWGRTGSRRAAEVALACVLAAVLIGIVARLVETDRERVERTLDTLADAAGSGDADKLMERVSPEYRNGALVKADLARAVRTGLAQVRATAESPIIKMNDRLATVTQVYRFTPAPGSRTGLPPGHDRVTWEGAFSPDPDGEWRLRSVIAIHPDRMAPEEAAKYLQQLR